MCGLVGVVGDLWANDKKAFTYMLMLDTIRGPHSTGVARIHNNNRQKVDIVKDVGTAWDLIGSNPDGYFNSEKERDAIVGDYAVLMGHNRWATVGDVTKENAHPFEAGKIVGAQNGTIPLEWRKKLVDYEFYKTDTEALMFNIDLKGVENVIPTIRGAWALTWYNRDEDTFNILRNDERPLCFAWKDNGKVLYYASEAWMIYQAADKYKVKLKDNQVYIFPSNTHYKIKIGNVFKFGQHCIEKSELKGFTTKVVDYSSHWKSNNVKSASDSANVFMKEGAKDGTSSKLPEASYEHWAGKVDQYVEFTVLSSITNDEQGMQFIEGRVVNGGPQVRLYSALKEPDLKALLGDKDALTFAGKIKKVKNTRKGVYVTLHSQTIMIAQYQKKNSMLGELFDNVNVSDANNQNIVKPEEPELVVAGRSCKLVSVEEYKDMVKKGCAWCCIIPTIKECEEIIWLEGEEFLCHECSSNEQVLSYVADYVTV